jgi:hypothetical protein
MTAIFRSTDSSAFSVIFNRRHKIRSGRKEIIKETIRIFCCERIQRGHKEDTKGTQRGHKEGTKRTQRGHKGDTKRTQRGHKEGTMRAQRGHKEDTKRTQRGHKEGTKRACQMQT